MKIVSVWFDYPGFDWYHRLVKVFDHSLRKSNPHADIEIVKIKPPRDNSKSVKAFTSNTVKMQAWIDIMNKTDDDIIFMDSDMMVLGDLSDAFNSDFDIGCTKRGEGRPGWKIPYNGGVVFMKNTTEARDFMNLWNKVNRLMYHNQDFHFEWHDKYAGMNQAAFGYILEKETFSAKIKEFEGRIWNSTCEFWQEFNGETKVVHVKSELRRAVLGRGLPKKFAIKYKNVIMKWNEFAREIGLKVWEVYNGAEEMGHNTATLANGKRRRRRPYRRGRGVAR